MTNIKFSESVPKNFTQGKRTTQLAIEKSGYRSYNAKMKYFYYHDSNEQMSLTILFFKEYIKFIDSYLDFEFIYRFDILVNEVSKKTMKSVQ